jgi:hypothetical protein
MDVYGAHRDSIAAAAQVATTTMAAIAIGHMPGYTRSSAS